MTAKPFIKWAGGKRQLLEQLKPLLPTEIENYYEPFLGGGAVFFALDSKKAYLNDLNEDLITAYKVVQTDVENLIDELKSYEISKEFYYSIRALDRDKEAYKNLSELKKAARFIYLNKTCFNGIYRVNSKNEFNVPYADYKHGDIVDEENLRAVNAFLNERKVEFSSCDFEKVLSEVKENSFVYLDPPYEPLSRTESFTSYTKEGFTQDDQKRLKDCCDKLTENNIKFMLSNSSADFIVDLYKDYNIEFVSAKRVINSKGSKRGEIKEVVVRNY